MTAKYILNDEGVPVPESDVVAWGRWFQTASRHVGFDDLGEVSVSTIFLGLDHRFVGNGPPILWETLVFGGPHDGDGERYTSREDAVAGHAKYLALVKSDAPAEAK